MVLAAEQGEAGGLQIVASSQVSDNNHSADLRSKQQKVHNHCVHGAREFKLQARQTGALTSTSEELQGSSTMDFTLLI